MRCNYFLQDIVNRSFLSSGPFTFTSSAIEKGLSELNIDRSLLVIIYYFLVKQVYFMQVILNDLNNI